MVFLTSDYMFIFIHKCGSRSILNILKRDCKKKNISILRDGIKGNKNLIHVKNNDFLFNNKHAYFINDWISFDKPKTFSIVRNPYARILSNYRNLKNRGKEDNLELFVLKVEKLLNSSKKELELLNREDKALLHHSVPQYKYICINDKVAVDKIFKLENLNSEFFELKKFLDIDIKTTLPKLNISDKIKTNILKENIAKKIFSIYENDFIILNYEFDSWIYY